tara:strand:- start:1660 stop:2136 length:477 start_codon:yes stop_codon:yes gene_type:complete
MLKKSLVIVVFLFSSMSYEAVSVKVVRDVYKKLCHVNAYKCPRLVITNDNEVNASAGLYTIKITQQMLSFLRNKHEAALVLGHELTHYNNNDYYKEGSQQMELTADYGGMLLMRKAGYNKCIGLGFMTHMQKVFGDGDWDGEHPKWMIRYARLSGGCR